MSTAIGLLFIAACWTYVVVNMDDDRRNGISAKSIAVATGILFGIIGAGFLQLLHEIIGASDVGSAPTIFGIVVGLGAGVVVFRRGRSPHWSKIRQGN